MAIRTTQQALTVFYLLNSAQARVTQQALTVLPLPYVQPSETNDDALLVPPGAFPMPAQGGPQYSRLVRRADEYLVDSVQFKTSGRDYRAHSQEYIRRWRIEYDMFENDAAAALLEAHWHAARGQFFGFDFTDPRTSQKFVNTHYDVNGLEFLATRRRWLQRRAVNLIWFSASGTIEGSAATGTWDSDTWDSALFGA